MLTTSFSKSQSTLKNNSLFQKNKSFLKNVFHPNKYSARTFTIKITCTTH